MDVQRDTLSTLAGLAAHIGPGLEPPGYSELLHEVTEAVRSLLKAQACSVAVLDRSEEKLIFVAASGAGAERVLGAQMPAGEGIAGWVVASGQSITVSDVTKDPRFAAEVAASTGYVPDALWALPLEDDGDVLGVMEVLDARAETNADDERAVAVLSHQAALALRVSLTFENLGAVFFRAVAGAVDDVDLSDALREAGSGTRKPAGDLGELAWLFYELGKLGPEERTAAVRMLSTFVSYAQARDPSA